jgi:dienelactone hydrolase
MMSGAYDMAGNVKEWVVNESAGRRAILGGAWDEVTYMFTSLDAHPPLARRQTFGLRCVRYPRPPGPDAETTLPMLARDFTKDRPVDDATFRILQGMYSYDQTDLAASIDAVDNGNPHWRREKVSFAAAYGGERVVAYLFLPTNAAPPYQAVVYFPGNAAFTDRHIDLIDLSVIDFVVRSGRAVLFPAYKGSFDRFIDGAPYSALVPAALRDNLIWWSKDLRRSVDYLFTRPDIDSSRLAYQGFSLGGCDALVCLALEGRFKTAVLIAGGLHGDHRYVPEDDPVNFVPRITLPVLLVGGRDDYIHPLDTAQKPLMRMLGTHEADKRHLVVDSGHVPPRGLYMREVLEWLDRYLGPVGER